MTTLNTIIEEEKKEFDGRMTSSDRYGGFYHGNKSGVELYNFDNVKDFLTTAMQRAYEAGEREADAKWEREVELLRTIPEHSSECLINEFPEHCDCDNYVNSNRTLDTLLSKIRS